VTDPISADAGVAEAVRRGTQQQFGRLVERHRRELRVHCYRMLGSFEEAEDLVQESFLRAWRARETFQGRSTLRAWLYRIATNACLEVLRRRRRLPAPSTGDAGRPPPLSSMPWLRPFPDALLDPPAAAEEGPEAVVVARETIALAFLATIQLLPPRQRAVLLMRDVLAFSAAETADLLEVTVASANSALQRARATLAIHQDVRAEVGSSPSTGDPRELALLARYMRAHEEGDPAAIVAVLREDARLTISPAGMCWEGREQITQPFLDGMGALGDWRCVPTRANRQPAVGNYLRRWGESEFRAFTLVVLAVEDGALAEMATFAEPALFAAFGLPPALP
jgi:RNA polymerase sigma-70 factor, ECF subfamily